MVRRKFRMGVSCRVPQRYLFLRVITSRDKRSRFRASAGWERALPKANQSRQTTSRVANFSLAGSTIDIRETLPFEIAVQVRRSSFRGVPELDASRQMICNWGRAPVLLLLRR